MDESMVSCEIRDQLVSTICRAVADNNPDLRQLSLLYYRLQSVADIKFLVLCGSNQRIGQVAHCNSPFRFRSLDACRKAARQRSGPRKQHGVRFTFSKCRNSTSIGQPWATGVPLRLSSELQRKYEVNGV